MEITRLSIKSKTNRCQPYLHMAMPLKAGFQEQNAFHRIIICLFCGKTQSIQKIEIW
jgi:hypothetical protein